MPATSTTNRGNPMQAWRMAAVCATMGMAVGCASLPDAQVNYYLPRAEVVLKVERYVTCKNETLRMWPMVTLASTYSADPARGPMQLDLAALDRWYAGSELTIALTADGRLASINSTNQGDGQAWAKTAASLAGMAISLGTVPAAAAVKITAPMAPESDEARARRQLCNIAKATTEGTAVFPYQARLRFQDPLDSASGEDDFIVDEYLPEAWRLAPAFDDATADEALEVLAGPMYASARRESEQAPMAALTVCTSKQGGRCPDYPVIRARMPVRYEVLLTEKSRGRTVGVVAVPQAGPIYDLPLPAPRLFGKQTAGLAFAADGSLTGISYGSTGGAAALAEGGTSLTESITDTSAERAERMNEQADEVASRARLERCLNAPATCELR